jgi:uncharacterized membrane protein
MHYERFFTFWAFACHLMFITGLAPCTFLMAVAVWLGSITHNMFLNPDYNVWFDFALHHAPFVLFIVFWGETKKRWWSKEAVLFTVIVFSSYIILNGGIFRVYEFYKDPHSALTGSTKPLVNDDIHIA